MNASTREALVLVVERARRIGSNTYLRSVKPDRTFTMSWTEDEGLRVERPSSPDQEPLDALTLNLRCFIQCNERTSFMSLAQLLDDDGLSQDWKQGFRTIRDSLNQYLDAPFGMQMYLDGLGSSNRRWLLYLFLYGDLAHTNKVKRDELERWLREPFFEPMIRWHFEETLLGLSHHIFWLSDLCQEELAKVAS